VFSKTLDKVGWNSKPVRDIVPEEITKLNELPGEDLEIGGATSATPIRTDSRRE
jgi:hypothetical protein